MPIDLVIDERDGGKPPELTGSTNGDGGTRSNADSTSHTDGASTPDVVSYQFFSPSDFLLRYVRFNETRTACIESDSTVSLFASFLKDVDDISR